MIKDREIALRLGDIGIGFVISLPTDGERALVSALGFVKSPLVGVENAKVVQDRGDIRMLGPQLLFVKLERVQVVRLGRLLPAAPAVDECDVIQHRAELRMRNISKRGGGLDGSFIESNRFLFRADAFL